MTVTSACQSTNVSAGGECLCQLGVVLPFAYMRTCMNLFMFLILPCWGGERHSVVRDSALRPQKLGRNEENTCYMSG